MSLIILQQPKTTTSLSTIFQRLKKLNPLTRAQDDGTLLLKYESNPVTETDDCILQNTKHGNLIEHPDGFTVTGVNNNEILKFPNG